MPVASTVNRVDYPGSGTTGPFPYTFRILEDADLTVVKRSTVGVDTTLTLTTDYTLTGAGSYAGGNVTLVVALATGESLSLRRVVDLTQDTDLRNQGAYYAETVEDIDNKATMALQQLQEQLDRSLHLSESEAGTVAKTTLPAQATRANAYLYFDAAGEPTAGSGLGTSIDGTTLPQVLDSVASLKAIAVPSDSPTVLLRGYHTAGDGGGGLFRWVAADAATANDGTIIQPTIGGGRYYRIMEDVANVRWFGAKGDGVTDDTNACNSALSSGSSVIRIPSGTYKLSAGLTVPAGVSMIGDGSGVSVLDGSIVVAGSHVSGYLVYAAGTGLTALPALSVSPVEGALSLTFASAPTLVVGDVIVIYNPTDYSFSGFRSYYREGEMVRVATVSGSTVTLQSPLASSYTSGSISLYRIAGTTASFKGFSLIGNASAATASGGLHIRYGIDCVVRDVISKGNTYLQIGIDRCFNTDLDNLRCEENFVVDASSTDYGLVIGNSHIVRVRGGYFSASRHGFTTGGGDFAGAIPNRFVSITGATIASSGTGTVNAADIHGNTEYWEFSHCSILGGVTPAGNHGRIASCHITMPNINVPAIYAAELRGVNFHIVDNDITTYQSAAIANRGVHIDFGGNSSVISSSTVAGGSIRIDGNRLWAPNIVAPSFSLFSIFIVQRGYTGVEKISVHIDGNHLRWGVSGEGYFVYVRRLTGGDAWEDIGVRENRVSGSIQIIDSVGSGNVANRVCITENVIDGQASVQAINVQNVDKIYVHRNIVKNSGYTPFYCTGRDASNKASIIAITDNIADNSSVTSGTSVNNAGVYLAFAVHAQIDRNAFPAVNANLQRRWSLSTLDVVKISGNYFPSTAVATVTETTITTKYIDFDTVFVGSATYDPANLVDGAGATTTVTVTGAALGDFCEASFSLDLQGITLTCWVSAADTVSVRFQNESGGALDLASGTLRARVRKS